MSNSNSLAMPSPLLSVFLHRTNAYVKSSQSPCEIRGRSFAVFLITPMAAVCIALDTIIGVIIGLTATIFCDYPLRDSNKKLLGSSNGLITIPVAYLLRALNPQAIVVFKNHQGPLATVVLDKINKYAIRQLQGNAFRRHVISRLTYLLYAIAAVVTKAVDGIIGVGCLVVALAGLGYNPFFNEYAIRGLSVPGVVGSVVSAILKCINPF